MKTHEEIKKALVYCNTFNNCQNCPYDKDGEGWGCVVERNADALAYIQQLENQIGELTEKVKQLEAAQPKWFSVKEKLPENDDNYLVFTSDRNDVGIATYYGDGEWLEHDLTNLIPHVTHWMPLPSTEGIE